MEQTAYIYSIKTRKEEKRMFEIAMMVLAVVVLGIYSKLKKYGLV